MRVLLHSASEVTEVNDETAQADWGADHPIHMAHCLKDLG